MRKICIFICVFFSYLLLYAKAPIINNYLIINSFSKHLSINKPQLLYNNFFLPINIFYQQSKIFNKPHKVDSLELILKQRNSKLKPELLISMAIRQMEENPEKALLLADLALIKAQHIGNLYLQSDALKLKADALYYLDSLETSLNNYLLSAETDLSSDKPRKDSILGRYGDAGHVNYLLGRYKKSIEFHNIALQMSIERKDTAEIATNYSNLGLVYNMMGDYAKSIDHFLQTLRLDKLKGNEMNMSTNYNSIGLVYFAWKKFDKALEFLELALKYDRLNKEEDKISIRLSNLSRVYLAINKYEKAINCLEEALKIDRKLKHTSKIAIRLQGLGFAYQSINKNEQALSYYTEALSMYEKMQMNFKIAGLKIQMGELYLKLGKLNKAEVSLKEGLKTAQELNLRPEEMDAVKQLYIFYKHTAKPADALVYHEQYKALQDSIFSEKSANLINEFEVKYESEKKDLENQLLLKKNEIHKKNQRLFFGAIIFLIVLAFILFWAFSLKRKSLNQSKKIFAKETEITGLRLENIENQNFHLQEMLFAEEEISKLQKKSLDQKNHELTTAAMLIANKNEVFEKLRMQAEQLKINLSETKTAEVRTMISEIDKQTDIENQWEQFKLHFESIHKTFFENLNKNDLRLTQNDLQLCAYIKLNLSTKEISSLMNITPESVNTHRYRLRKKLNLEADVPLDEFIHHI
jgi:tetratricopeptide (TPR) repeat protein